jgi:hypothetical protein
VSAPRWVVLACAVGLVAACAGGESDDQAAGLASADGTVSSSTSTNGSALRRTTTTRAVTIPPDDPAEIAGMGGIDPEPAPAPTTIPSSAPTPTQPAVPTASTDPPPPPPPPSTVPVRDLPGWSGSTQEIGPDLAGRMAGVSWHEGCPVAIADLRHLRLDHVGFDGHRHQGELVVHVDVADAVLEAFRRMYEARFPIQRVALVDEAGGSDAAAMAANLTTAFNCRRVTGGTGWSEHSYGRAIDINPVENPYISSRGTVLPPAGAAYLDRTTPVIGLIVEGGPAVAAFDAVGWHWGGRWRTIKDYQHFSATGR